MKQTLVLRFLAIIAVLSLVSAVFAQGGGNPHFNYATYSIDSTTGALSLSFKQAGLGSFQSVDYSLTGDVDATFGCINRGNNRVQGQPFRLSVSGVTSSDNFPVSNGQVTATMTLSIPGAGSLDCRNHELRLLSVTWSNIVFTWGDGNLGPSPGTLSYP